MKVIYLAAGHAKLKYDNVVYQDMFVKRDLGGCMLDVDLNDFDILIATPPCNYWSRARGNKMSKYAENTKHLLPAILDKFVKADKPFLVENVINKVRMRDIINNF